MGCACCPTPPPSLRLGPGLTTSLTSCMPRELLFIGMLERVWKRESSLRLGKTWLLWRRIMKRLAWTALRLRERPEKNTNFLQKKKTSYQPKINKNQFAFKY